MSTVDESSSRSRSQTLTDPSTCLQSSRINKKPRTCRVERCPYPTNANRPLLLRATANQRLRHFNVNSICMIRDQSASPSKTYPRSKQKSRDPTHMRSQRPSLTARALSWDQTHETHATLNLGGRREEARNENGSQLRYGA